ncbi:MAG: ComF family protein [Pseudomonadota bacterium]
MGVDMARLGARAMQTISGGIEALWPSRSLVSSRRDIGEGAVSPQEWAELTFLMGPVCDQCGLPQEVDLGPLAICAACIAKPPKWRSARAALAYDDASRRIVLDVKRTGRRDGLKTIAGWMLQAGRPLIERADLMVPVPLHYRRLASRGFNQSGWLAASVSRRAGLPVRIDILKRRKATPSQAGLSPKARHRNVAGAFSIRKGKERAIAGKSVLLVDDVLTTGATLTGCARTLLKAGASRVDVLTLARVVRVRDSSI